MSAGKPQKLTGQALRAKFRRGVANDVLRTYVRLNEGQVCGEHWLWTAIERVSVGESEAEVMADYGYAPERKS